MNVVLQRRQALVTSTLALHGNKRQISPIYYNLQLLASSQG